MKLLIASDIHGDLDSAKAVLAAYEREGLEFRVKLCVNLKSHI